MNSKLIQLAMKPYQFSLLSLVGIILLFSVLLGCTFGLSQQLGLFILQLLSISASSVLITVIVYTRGAFRAFAVGAVFPQLFVVVTYSEVGYIDIWSSSQVYATLEYTRALALVPWIHSIILGIISVVIWRHVKQFKTPTGDRNENT